MEDFSERFSPAIRGVVEFAKRIPGFSMLAQEDQVTLLKVRSTRFLALWSPSSNHCFFLVGGRFRSSSGSSGVHVRLGHQFDGVLEWNGAAKRCSPPFECSRQCSFPVGFHVRLGRTIELTALVRPRDWPVLRCRRYRTW